MPTEISTKRRGSEARAHLHLVAAALLLGASAADLLFGARAAADEGPGKTAVAASAPAEAVLQARVFERGTISPLPGAEIQTSTGDSCVTDADGRCAITLVVPAGGKVDVRVAEPNHEALRVTETITAGRALTVEYRLLPVAAHSRRYETTARGDGRTGGERFTLRDEELRQAPGSLGDPFRVIAMMPGVSTPIPLAPYYVVRGASPGMNGFFLDGMRVPQLFHLLVGGGVVHPRMVERLDFYPGSYDASFGRYAGGIIDTETRMAQPGLLHGEVELRFYDVSAFFESTLPRGVKIEVAGHYGFPGPIIRLLQPGIDVQYGDYQFRLDWRGLTVEALGSYDNLNVASSANFFKLANEVAVQSRLSFHRLQIRERFRRGRVDFEAALVGGVDDVSLLSGQGVRKLSLGGRMNIKVRAGWFTLRSGADFELSRFGAQQFSTDDPHAAPDALGELGGNRDGVVGSAWAEGGVSAWSGKFSAVAGVRADVYHAGRVTLVGVDPRVQLHLRPFVGTTTGDVLGFSAAVGLYQQPPSFPVPLPGIDTYALQLGLQRAIQGSGSVEARFPQSVSLSVTGYYQRFHNANDVVIDFTPAICTVPPPEFLTGLPALLTRQVEGEAFGMELLLRRREGRVTGWVAYTLSRSSRSYSCGLRPADFDQTHVLNVVVQVRLPWRLMIGARLYVASGRPYTKFATPDNPFVPSIVPVRNNERFAPYVQLDLRLDREWIFQRWALAAFLEVVNTTYSETIYGVGYPKENGLVRYDHPQASGFPWILPSLGLRARF